MPDRDGIGRVCGRSYCHGCGRWLMGRDCETEHRRRCGRRWRLLYPARRAPNGDERTLQLAIEASIGEERG